MYVVRQRALLGFRSNTFRCMGGYALGTTKVVLFSRRLVHFHGTVLCGVKVLDFVNSGLRLFG